MQKKSHAFPKYWGNCVPIITRFQMPHLQGPRIQELDTAKICQNDFRNELSEQATVSSLHFPMAVDVVYSSLADAHTVIFKATEHRAEKQC